MTHLLPEKRRDSNGRMVTRWVKPAATSTASNIPAPKVAVSSTVHDVFKLVYPNRVPPRAEKRRESLAEMFKIDAKLSPLLNTVLTTGTETGKEAVREFLDDSIDFITDTRTESAYAVDWSFRCRHALGDKLRERVTRLWAAGNVAEQVGSSVTSKRVASEAEDAHLLLFNSLESTTLQSERNRFYDPKHWRGMAALAFCVDLEVADTDSDQFYEYGAEFVEWAGDRDDLKEIIELSISRNVINPETLQGLLESTGDVHGSISHGIL